PRRGGSALAAQAATAAAYAATVCRPCCRCGGSCAAFEAVIVGVIVFAVASSANFTNFADFAEFANGRAVLACAYKARDVSVFEEGEERCPHAGRPNLMVSSREQERARDYKEIWN